MLTIPATDVRPGDLVDTSNAVPPGPVVRVRQVATWGDRTYIARRDTGYLVPDGCYWPRDAHVDVYGRAS